MISIKRIVGIILSVLGGILLLFVLSGLILVMIGILPMNTEMQFLIDNPSYTIGQLFVYSIPLIVGLYLLRKQ